MKKLFLLSAVAMFIGMPLVYAEHHEGGEGKGGAMMDKKFAKDDLNGDGMISKDEFLKAAETKFSKMDANGDGSLTKEEAKAHMEQKRGKWKEMKEKRDGAVAE